MGLTYAESLALRLPGMTEEERKVVLWRLQWAELYGLARRYGIEQKMSKPQLIHQVSQAAQERATVEIQGLLV